MAVGGLCKTSTFRCLCFVRCVVATVVTVLAAVVVASAVFVIFNPQKIKLKIPSSTVQVQRLSPESFLFSFSIEATNLRDRTFIYYNNITVQLVNITSAISLAVAEFNLTSAITLSQRQIKVYYLAETINMSKDQEFVSMFFGTSNLTSKGVSLIIDGLLIDYAEGTFVTNVYRAIYNCALINLISNADIPTANPNNAANCAPSVFLL